MTEDIIARINGWTPSMTEYHLHDSISSGFLSRAHSHWGEGLSTALAERWQWKEDLAAAQRFIDREIEADRVKPGTQARLLTTEPRLVTGTVLHAWIEGDATIKIRIAPPEVKVRRGKRWEAAKLGAIQSGAQVLTTQAHYAELMGIWASLWTSQGTPYDTGAKRKIRAMLRRWEPRFPEVSHLWEPLSGCLCRIRQDLIAQAPKKKAWCAVSIKTTSKPLTPGRWWPFWRLNYSRSEAFYRAGLKGLFGDTPFAHILLVARTVPPHPWALFNLGEKAEELDAIWQKDCLPELQTITDCIESGHGPEERGFEL